MHDRRLVDGRRARGPGGDNQGRNVVVAVLRPVAFHAEEDHLLELGELAVHHRVDADVLVPGRQVARRALVGQHQHGHHEDQHAAGLQLVLGAAQEEPLQPLLLVALLVAGHHLVVVGRVQVQEADRLVAADHILPGGVDGGGGEVLAAAAGALGVQLDGIAGRLAGAGEGLVEDRERVALAGAGVEEAGLAGGLEAVGDTGDVGGAGGVVLHFAGAGEP